MFKDRFVQHRSSPHPWSKAKAFMNPVVDSGGPKPFLCPDSGEIKLQTWREAAVSFSWVDQDSGVSVVHGASS